MRPAISGPAAFSKSMARLLVHDGSTSRLIAVTAAGRLRDAFANGNVAVAHKLMPFQNFYQLFRTIQAV
jgi:hypothetical protein